jgi:hypothetical protein
MKTNVYRILFIKMVLIILVNFIFLKGQSQNAVKSTPLGIGKQCGTSKDSFRLMGYDDPTNNLTVSYKCKPNLGGGSPSGPAFSSSSGSIAFNPKEGQVYYIATTTGNNSFVYTWVPNSCPATQQAYDYYYPGQFVVGLDFDPLSSTGDGYQLEFTGSAAPYTLWLRKVNFASNYFGTSVQIALPAGKKIYQQRGDIIFTPQGGLYFAFDDKLFSVNFSNYSSGVVSATYIDTLPFPSGYHLTGISYANGKFIGSTQNSGSGCAFKEIDISTGSAVISNVTLTNGNYTAVDMATLINGIGVAKKVYAVAPWSANRWIVQYDIKIKNFGNTVLNNVQLTEDLSTVFGGLLTSATVAAVGTLPAGLTLNASFNGSSNKNIFTGGASSILNTSPADSAIVRVTVVLTNPNVNTTYYTSAIGSATDKLFSTSISDSSNNDGGLRSDLNANGVTDDSNEDIRTPLRIIDWISLGNNIIDFNGSYADNKVNLHWNLQNTEDGLLVNIQRSADGKNFQSLGSLNIRESQDQERYTWTDLSPYSSANFYRLEFVKKNGTRFYSEVLPISIRTSRSKAMAVLPNPFRSVVTFSIDLEQNQNVKYKLLSMDSRIVASGEKSGQYGFNSFTIDNLSNLPSGTYFLQVAVGSETYHKVVIKAY